MNNNLRLLKIIRCIRHANLSLPTKAKAAAIPKKAVAMTTTPLLSNGIMAISVGMWIAIKITTEISTRR